MKRKSAGITCPLASCFDAEQSHGFTPTAVSPRQLYTMTLRGQHFQNALFLDSG